MFQMNLSSSLGVIEQQKYNFSFLYISKDIIKFSIYYFICIYIFMYLFIYMYMYEYYFSMFFLTFCVCESVVGLGVLVSLIRTHSNDYYNTLNMC